jgi:hypothetical protein
MRVPNDIYLSIYLLSIYLSIYPSIHLPIYLQELVDTEEPIEAVQRIASMSVGDSTLLEQTLGLFEGDEPERLGYLDELGFIFESLVACQPVESSVAVFERLLPRAAAIVRARLASAKWMSQVVDLLTICLQACSGSPSDVLGLAFVSCGGLELALEVDRAHAQDPTVVARLDLLANAVQQIALLQGTGEAMVARLPQLLALARQCRGTSRLCRVVLAFDRTHSKAAETKGSLCVRCSKLSDAPKYCSNCKIAYCSKECQVDDWKRGSHKQECQMRHNVATAEGWGKSDGSVTSVKNRILHDLPSKDFSKAGDDLFMERYREVMLQAVLLGTSVLDCVIELSFLDGRSARVVPKEEFLQTHSLRSEDDNDSHTLFVIERNRGRGNLTGMCTAKDGSVDVNDGVGYQNLLKTFPVPEGETSNFWSDKQREMEAAIEVNQICQWYHSVAPDCRQRFLRALVADGIEAATEVIG